MRLYAAPRAPRVRVNLFPQSPYGGGEVGLETVTLSTRVDELGPGPTDRRFITFDAPHKRPYDPAGRDGRGPTFPPYEGHAEPPVRPGPDGHLDHLSQDNPGFRAAHLYGCARFALDVWEGYYGAEIPWHFAAHFDQLELLALRNWANGHMGYGFLEVGERHLEDGSTADLALDFDVIGHEIGHALLMSAGGLFVPSQVSADYAAFHEASADCAALMTALHFDGVVTELLENTKGNLFLLNRLNRVGEYSHNQQIRLANNGSTMWDFAFGWETEHDLALPVIGGMFDAFVSVYHEILVQRGLIPRSLEQATEAAQTEGRYDYGVQVDFGVAYARKPYEFLRALEDARDIAATFLVGLWIRIEPQEFVFAQLGDLLADIDAKSFDGSVRSVVEGFLSVRGVGRVRPGPRMRNPSAQSCMQSVRTLGP